MRESSKIRQFIFLKERSETLWKCYVKRAGSENENKPAPLFKHLWSV